MNRGKGSKGFTLVELAVTIVIISILALIGGGSYRLYVRRAMAVEGVTFGNSIAMAEDIYFHKFGEYFETVGAQNSFKDVENSTVIECPELHINSRELKYFKRWRVCCCEKDKYKYDIYVIGSGEGQKLQVRMHKPKTTGPLVLEITDNET